MGLGTGMVFPIIVLSGMPEHIATLTCLAKEWLKIAATILKLQMIHKNPEGMTMGWHWGMNQNTWQPFQTTWNNALSMIYLFIVKDIFLNGC